MNIPLRQYWNLLRDYLKAQRKRVALLAVLMLTGIALEIVNPQVLRFFIDSVTAGSVAQSLLAAALIFIGVALIRRLMTIGAVYVGEGISWNATNSLRADVALHCLKLDMTFHNARTPGELIERIDGDVTALSNFFSQFVVRVVGNLFLLVGVLIVLYAEDWRIGVGLTGFAVFALVVLIRIRSLAVPHWRRVRQVSAEFFGFLGERLAGTEDIRASGATGYVQRRFTETLRRWLPLQMKAGMAGYTMWMTTLAVFAVGTVVAFGLGAWLYGARAITIGTVYLIFFYTEMIRQPIEQIRQQLEDLQRAGASIGRIRELLDLKSKIQVADEAIALPDRGPLSVAFENVSFSYADDEPVLEDVTFDLPPGQVLGLLGRTGSGKTTLARLLLRLYDPRSGDIRLGNGRPGGSIRSVRESDLRGRVGMVTQDVQLFHASVRDNLTFFDSSVPDDRIQSELEQLGLWPRIASLPDGLDTELASGGSGLSAGEAQLLAFARLFLRDPGLVILDEASSRLDPATEQLIERAVDRLLANRTGIIIAHRLATVQRADAIMILENGRIVEYGERERLMRDPDSRFYHLLQTGLEEVLA